MSKPTCVKSRSQMEKMTPNDEVEEEKKSRSKERFAARVQVAKGLVIEF